MVVVLYLMILCSLIILTVSLLVLASAIKLQERAVKKAKLLLELAEKYRREQEGQWYLGDGCYFTDEEKQ